MNLDPAHRPFELDGRFFPGSVQAAGTCNRKGRRRMLCFVTQAGFVGASSNFNRAEAYYNAVRAERGLLPQPPAGLNAAATITHLLKSRGMPVRSAQDELDDETAALVQQELMKRNAAPQPQATAAQEDDAADMADGLCVA